MSEENELTTKEVSEILKVSQAYVRQLCIAGKLQARKLGRDWYIRADDVRRFDEARRK